MKQQAVGRVPRLYTACGISGKILKAWLGAINLHRPGEFLTQACRGDVQAVVQQQVMPSC